MVSYSRMAKKAADKSTLKKYLKLNRKYLLIISVLLLVIVVMGVFLLFFSFFYNKVYPGVYVNGVHIGGLSQEVAKEKLQKNLLLPEEIKIKINYKDPLEFSIPLSLIDARAEYDATTIEAYNQGRTDNRINDAQTVFRQFLEKKNISLTVSYSEEKLDEQLSIIRSQSPTPPKDPSLSLSSGEIVFTPGEKGALVNLEALKDDIVQSIRSDKNNIVYTPETVDPTLTPSQKNAYINRGKALIGKEFVLSSDNSKFTYNDAEILSTLNPKGGYYFENLAPPLSEVAEAVKSPPTNPVFTFSNGRVEEFSPAKDGLEVVLTELENKISSAIDELESTDVDSIVVDIPVTRTKPDFATGDVNDLGIKELIGIGNSTFKHSISSRVFNIAHAAAKLNGILIKPGETFSFVNTLGDISTLTGYKQAYVIQGDQTILGDGGGVCQVSTTFFRAALNAGLPIVERHAHSYRVGYYEQDSPPGVDATIFHPTVDLKIKNDTPGYILIQSFVDTKNMTLKFEFYGTSDGRVSTVSTPVVTSVTPPPEDLYIDDPNMPTGEIKQIDYKAWGAKVKFNYSVERDGETIFEDTYYSNYRPWQAKFLRGTGPVQ